LGRASVIRRDTQGGTLALKGMRGHAWQDAEKRMAAHCGPGNWQVLKEEQVVVGQRTVTTGDAEESEHYGENSTRERESYQETTRTEDVTEYRITYQCGGGGQPATAQPSTPPPSTAQAQSGEQGGNAPQAQPAPGAQPTSGGSTPAKKK
jgi:hypothetical protein